MATTTTSFLAADEERLPPLLTSIQGEWRKELERIDRELAEAKAWEGVVNTTATETIHQITTNRNRVIGETSKKIRALTKLRDNLTKLHSVADACIWGEEGGREYIPRKQRREVRRKAPPRPRSPEEEVVADSPLLEDETATTTLLLFPGDDDFLPTSLSLSGDTMFHTFGEGMDSFY